MCGCVCHRPTSLFRRVCFKDWERAFCACMLSFISSSLALLIVFALHLCQTQHAAVVVILFPSAGKWHQVMSSPIKPVLKCVRFQAITRIVRDRGSSAQQFPLMSQRG